MTQTARPSPSPVVNGVAPAHSAPGVPTTARPQALSKAKGLQVGATKQPLSKTAASSLAAELEKEAAAEIGGGDARSNEDDLIDVNADAGDWSEPLCLPFG
jgi:SCY1-like protein 1